MNCPHCNNPLDEPYGNLHADVLIVGETWKDDRWVRILRDEFNRKGVDLYGFRITNLWNHKKSKNEDCLLFSIEQLQKELEGKKAVLLLGADTVRTLCGIGVNEVTGLLVESQYFDVPIIMACPNPALALNAPLGEIRLVVYKFLKCLKENKNG